MQRGESLGRFRIIGLLGRGGMAEVYLAATQGPGGFEKRVALKVPLPHLAENVEVTAMLMDEARLAAQLEHRNIASVIELAEHEGRHLIAQEYVRGVSLSALIREMAERGKRLPPEVAVFVAGEIAAGLHYAHTATGADGQPLGVVHRDVTPSNLLLSVQGDVKLVDFGIAKATYRTHHTTRSMLKGKAGYMAPEQANLGNVGPPADQFALGAVLFEMLAGRRLYEGEHDLELLDKARNADISLEEVAIPEPVRPVLERMLQPRQNERFESVGRAGELLAEALAEMKATEAACRQALADLVQQHIPAEPREDPSIPSVAPTRRIEPERARRSPPVMFLVFAAALVLVVAGLWLLRLSPPPAAGDGIPTVYLTSWENPAANLGLDDLTTLGPGLVGGYFLHTDRLQPVLWYRLHDEATVPGDGWRLEARVDQTSEDDVRVDAWIRDPRGARRQHWTYEGATETFPALTARLAEDASAFVGAPIQVDETHELDYVRHFQPGVEQLRRQSTRAFQRFNETAQRFPEYPEPYLWAATVAWWGGPSSLSWLDQLIAMGQEHQLEPQVIDELKVMRGFVEEGHEAWYDRAVALGRAHPDDPFALFVAGEAHVHTGEVAEGVRLLWRVMELEPQLILAETHPTRVAFLRGNGEQIERALRIRRADPTDPALTRFELEKRVAVRDYAGAAELGRSHLHENTEAGLGIETGMVLGLIGEEKEAEEVLAQYARQSPYAGTISAWASAMGIALYHEDEDAYRDWRDRAMPAGPEGFGHTVEDFSPQYRLAVQGRLLALLRDADDVEQWARAVERVRKIFPDERLGSYDTTLQTIMQCVEAYHRNDRKRLAELADDRAWMPSLFAEALRLEVDGHPTEAVQAYDRAIALQIDGEYHAILAYGRARAARAAGRNDLVEPSCDVVLHPRVLTPYFGALAPECREWMGETRG